MRFGRSAVAGDDGSVVFYSCELGVFYCACFGRGGRRVKGVSHVCPEDTLAVFFGAARLIDNRRKT